MQVLCCSLFGYLLGSVNLSYILSRLAGFDIRERGSGNAGASNVTIIMGKKAGAAVAVFDILKAVLAVNIAARLFPTLCYARILSGCSCILGHILPFLMGFHGGKGLACLGGMLLAYDSHIFLIMLLCEIAVVLVFDYIFIVPISASMVFTSVYAFDTGDFVGTFLLGMTTMLILYKHIENIHRVLDGTEAHVSILWHRSEELDRIEKNRKA